MRLPRPALRTLLARAARHGPGTPALVATLFLAATPVVAPAQSPESQAPSPAPILLNLPRVLLWPQGAPDAQGEAPTDQPALTVHLPPRETATGCGVIVNPGGGYHVLAADHEGLQVARWLNRQGIAAFVLRYRLLPSYDPAVALTDGQRAVQHVRAHAADFGIDPRRVGMMGFSAGGHLAAAVGTAPPDEGTPDPQDPVDRQSSRPAFLGLIYPAISTSLLPPERRPTASWPSLEDRVNASTPPAFLVHTHEDGLSPNHSILFYQGLLAHQVSAELHIFARGPHGTGLAPGDPDLGSWPDLFHRWLRRQGFLTSALRKEVTGRVLLEGQPLPWGWLTFIPEDPQAPHAAAYIHPDDDGHFRLAAHEAPCLGTHRLEIHQVARHFAEKTSGAYTLHDSRQWTTDPEGSPLILTLTDANRSDLTVRVGGQNLPDSPSDSTAEPGERTP